MVNEHNDGSEETGFLPPINLENKKKEDELECQCYPSLLKFLYNFFQTFIAMILILIILRYLNVIISTSTSENKTKLQMPVSSAEQHNDAGIDALRHQIDTLTQMLDTTARTTILNLSSMKAELNQIVEGLDVDAYSNSTKSKKNLLNYVVGKDDDSTCYDKPQDVKFGHFLGKPRKSIQTKNTFPDDIYDITPNLMTGDDKKCIYNEKTREFIYKSKAMDWKICIKNVKNNGPVTELGMCLEWIRTETEIKINVPNFGAGEYQLTFHQSFKENINLTNLQLRTHEMKYVNDNKNPWIDEGYLFEDVCIWSLNIKTEAKMHLYPPESLSRWKFPDVFGSLDMIYFIGDSTMKRMFDTFRSRTNCANEKAMKGRLHADMESSYQTSWDKKMPVQYIYCRVNCSNHFREDVLKPNSMVLFNNGHDYINHDDEKFDEEMSHLVTIMNELQITLPIYLESPAQNEEYWTPSWVKALHTHYNVVEKNKQEHSYFCDKIICVNFFYESQALQKQYAEDGVHFQHIIYEHMLDRIIEKIFEVHKEKMNLDCLPEKTLVRKVN